MYWKLLAAVFVASVIVGFAAAAIKERRSPKSPKKPD
jgi:hypothetical protein